MKIEKISDSLGWQKKEIEQKTIDAVAASRAHLSLSLSLSLSPSGFDTANRFGRIDRRRLASFCPSFPWRRLHFFFFIFLYFFFYNVRDFRFVFFSRVVRLLLICQRRRRVTSSTILFCFVFFVSSFLFLPSKLSSHTHTHQSIC